MMSCGVALERIHINELHMSSATETKDSSGDFSGLNSTQQTDDKNTVFDQPTKCSDVEREARNTSKKQVEKMQQDHCSVDCTEAGCGSCATGRSTANLRITLKKIKVDSGDKKDDTCVYVCHTKKPNKLRLKHADRSSVNKVISRAASEDDGLADSLKVSLLFFMLFTPHNIYACVLCMFVAICVLIALFIYLSNNHLYTI